MSAHVRTPSCNMCWALQMGYSPPPTHTHTGSPGNESRSITNVMYELADIKKFQVKSKCILVLGHNSQLVAAINGAVTITTIIISMVIINVEVY